MIENIKNVGVEVNNHYDTIERSYVQMILGMLLMVHQQLLLRFIV